MNKILVGILICMLLIFTSISAFGQIGIYDSNMETTGMVSNSIEGSKTTITFNKITISDRKTNQDNPIAMIETTMGTIYIELYKSLVPNTVGNFINLTKVNFYDGLVFHRVVEDFVIQGGGYYPDGTRKNSPFGTIDLEIHPNARHIDGAVGMARTSNPNSATSQFYICDGPQHFLDDEYAVFGVVKVGSMPVVRAIAGVETTTKYGLEDWPIEDVIINSLAINSIPLDLGQVSSPVPGSILYQALDNYLEFLMQYPNLFTLFQKLLQGFGL
jgi:cyclophilin family peptidyl-prolyl cis-trans isomerase